MSKMVFKMFKGWRSVLKTYEWPKNPLQGKKMLSMAYNVSDIALLILGCEIGMGNTIKGVKMA